MLFSSVRNSGNNTVKKAEEELYCRPVPRIFFLLFEFLLLVHLIIDVEIMFYDDIKRRLA